MHLKTLCFLLVFIFTLSLVEDAADRSKDMREKIHQLIERAEAVGGATALHDLYDKLEAFVKQRATEDAAERSKTHQLSKRMETVGGATAPHNELGASVKHRSIENGAERSKDVRQKIDQLNHMEAIVRGATALHDELGAFVKRHSIEDTPERSKDMREKINILKAYIEGVVRGARAVHDELEALGKHRDIEDTAGRSKDMRSKIHQLNMREKTHQLNKRMGTVGATTDMHEEIKAFAKHRAIEDATHCEQLPFATKIDAFTPWSALETRFGTEKYDNAMRVRKSAWKNCIQVTPRLVYKTLARSTGIEYKPLVASIHDERERSPIVAPSLIQGITRAEQSIECS
ncbi:hypothetical protein B0H19DRAFT_1270023 [Mycena capillaripes]|nr:hypothetical protein B0H19DRAFT_1270023 [Mycena capillaripes]